MPINNPYMNYTWPYSQMPYQMPAYQMPQQEQRSDIIWVQGEEAAKAYQVAAGQKVIIFDSEAACFYVKETDLNGVPKPVMIFDYTEREKTEDKGPEYVTKEYFDSVIAELRSSNRTKKEAADEQAV